MTERGERVEPAARQVVPRPPGSRPGRPAPWADLPIHRRRFDADALRSVFTGRVGASAFPDVVLMQARPAAVLAAFYEDGPGELVVVLTRRSMALRNHTGEVSFPGGRTDEGENPVATALREAQEEIGLEPATVEVLGELDHYMTLVSRSFIVPVVALLPGPPRLRANAGEVDEILQVPVADLLDDGVFREEVWRLPAEPPGEPGELVDRSIYFFDLATDTVWGATANMLRHLLSLALGLPVDAYRR
jgi:8-oxo-dGTP pyrophosphatase MutT (NUDIX family)